CQGLADMEAISVGVALTGTRKTSSMDPLHGALESAISAPINVFMFAAVNAVDADPNVPVAIVPSNEIV
ncbi:hypothetical protein, partial [Pantoea ananatis]|uniref:hypothetical protein n=1 Tax=Pantoea ananas TaxID=553 RepID=UPI002B1E7F17